MYIRRKVYSVVDDNLYSVNEIAPAEENLYSVSMTEEEYALFSDFCEGYYEGLYADTSANDYYMRQAINNSHEVDPKTGKITKKVAQPDKKLYQEKKKMYEDVFKDVDAGEFDSLTKEERKIRKKNGPNDNARTGFTEAEQKANREAAKKVKKMKNKEWDSLHTADKMNEATSNLRHVQDLERAATERGRKAGYSAGHSAGHAAGFDAGMKNAGFKQAWNNSSTLKKAGIAGLGAAAVGGAGYGAYRLYKDKKSKK